jgi:hypothetical protein
MTEGVLTERETLTLLENALKANPEGVTESDLRLIYKWACEAKVDAVLLDGVLKGTFAVSVRDGEVMFASNSRGRA